MTALNEELALFHECINGSKQSWDLFVERYANLIYKTILRTVKTYNVFLELQEIRDVYHSIFLSLLENDCKKLRQFEGKGQCSPASWIRVISRNYTINFINARRQHISLDDDREKTGPLVNRIRDKKPSVHDEMETVEEMTCIKRAISELPPNDRFFIKLYYFKELPPEKIAGIMNVSLNTVYSKKNRISEKIKKILTVRGIIARKSG